MKLDLRLIIKLDWSPITKLDWSPITKLMYDMTMMMNTCDIIVGNRACRTTLSTRKKVYQLTRKNVYSKSGFLFREKKPEKSAKSKKLKRHHFRFFFRSVFFSPNEKRVISIETLSWKRKIMLDLVGYSLKT